MGIEELKELLPHSSGKSLWCDWEKAERLIGVALPTDFKKFIEFYGGGQIDSFLSILSPFEENEYRNLIDRIAINKDNRQILKEQFDQIIPYHEFPAEGSLLQFGVTDNGDDLFWKVGNNGQTWSVVVNESRSHEYEEFESSFVEFLVKLLTRQIRCRAFPRDFPLVNHSFESFG